MAEKGNKKSKKAAAKDSGVLASLPSTRPNRMGSSRRQGATPGAAAAKPAPAAKAAAKPPKAKPKPKRKKAPVVKAKPMDAAQPVPITDAGPKRPTAVRSTSKNLAEPARKSAKQRGPASGKRPSGPELVGTVVQAAGELAQVGLSIGGQVIKRAVDRLPKP